MKLRVLHVSHSAGLSGAEQALLRVLRGVDRARVESLVALPADGPLRSELAGSGVKTFVLPTRWWIPATHWSRAEFVAQLEGLEGRWQDLADFAARERVDLIHSNTLVTIEGALAAVALGIPHLWHTRGVFGHGFPPAYADDWSFYYSIVDEIAGNVVCVSKSVLAQTTQYVRNTPSSVITDGFDADEHVFSNGPDIRQELGLAGSAALIACIGGIQRRKGQLDAIEAMPFIKREHPEAVLLLCGAISDVEYGEEVRARIEEMRLSSCVRILGFRRDVGSILHQCRLVVHPSWSEGFPLAILESMAAGKPVVATRCGGPEDMIEDGVSGVLVSVSSPVELARAVCLLLSDADRTQAIGIAARQRAALFSVSASAIRLQDLLSELVSSAPLRSPDPAKATSVSTRVVRKK
jgi:glycosyltransferase involved in cell wall biosynthesis